MWRNLWVKTCGTFWNESCDVGIPRNLGIREYVSLGLIYSLPESGRLYIYAIYLLVRE